MLDELSTKIDGLSTSALKWPSFTTLIAAVAALLLAVLLRRRYLSPISHIPGPFLASFTRLWHVGQILKGKQNMKLVELHDKYGHFVRIAHNEVSVSHPSGIKANLTNPGLQGDWYRIYVFPDWRYPATMSMCDPKEKSKFMQYMSNAGFLLHNVVKYEDSIDENISKLLGWMNRHAETHEPMELDKFFTYVTFDVAGEITFSKPFGFIDQGKDIDNSIAFNIGLEIFLAIFGFYRKASYILNNPLMTWSHLLPVGHIANTAAAALKERQKNPDAKFDMSAHWFKGLEKAKKDNYTGFTERHVLAAAVSNLGAGSDTVSCALQSFVYHLIRMPDKWSRLKQEIDVARRQGRCKTPVITWKDASQLPYLEACIKEALRVLAPIAMGLPRLVPKGGVTIGDMTFPEGTTLSINPTLSKEFWGPDAREFNPDRWLDPDISKREKYFMPWGLGWASCPGQHLAKFQCFKILATIVRDYDIKQVDPENEWKYAAYFTLVPHDWPVYIKRRGH